MGSMMNVAAPEGMSAWLIRKKTVGSKPNGTRTAQARHPWTSSPPGLTPR